MSSSRSSSISQENIGQKWSPTDVRLTARPQLVYTSSLNWFDSDLEYYSDRSEDEHPADEFSPNQKHSLMTLPHEIRDRIFYLVAEPEFWTDEHGRTRIDSGVEHLRRLPIEIRSTVVSIYYRRRYLLIDLPNFEPNPLISKFHDGIKQYTWPSEIHFHDQWNDLSFRTVPGFLSRGDRGATRLKCATHEDIRQLPLHLFKEIVIKIPASQSGDIAQLMMNWNRLRFLGHVLINAVDIDRNRNFRERITYGSRGLPPVRVVFLEDEKSGTSWFDKDGKLKISIPLPAELLLGEEREQSSDLLLLLRALAPVRGSNKFFVEPTLPNSFQNLDFSLAWMAQNSTQKQRFGECIDMRWNDALSFHWLTRFEIYLHRLLHNLDTPIAPFLRLEQMATVSHHKHERISRYAARYRQTSEICRGADDIMTAVGSCAFALAPAQGLSLCQCVNSAKGLTDTNDKAHACCVLGFGEYCTRSCGAQNYQDLYDTQSKNWEDEFVALRRRLLSLNGCILTDDGRFVTKNFQPLNSPITLGQIFGFKHNINDRPTTAWEFNNIGNRCGCFIPKALPKQGTRNLQKTRRSDPEAWIKAWPYGIIHDKGIIRSYRARHECQQLQEDPYANGRYLCLDRSRRDENGICDGGKQNTSASFLEQFAHLTTKSSQHNSSGPLVTQSFGV